MPINHSRRLQYPKNSTVIDPVTNQRVLYSDYIRMEEERQASNFSADDHNGGTDSTASTPKADNHGDDNDQERKSGDEYDSSNEENPNSKTTESVLHLGDSNESHAIENDSDAQLQSQINESLSQKAYKSKKELLQAKATLRAEQLESERSKRSTKKTTTKPTKKKSNLAKNTKSTSTKKASKTSETAKTPKKSNTNKTKKPTKMSQPETIEIDASSAPSSDTDASSDSESSQSSSDTSSNSTSSSSSSQGSDNNDKPSNQKTPKGKKKGRPKDDNNYYQPIQDDEDSKARLSKNARKNLKKFNAHFAQFIR